MSFNYLQTDDRDDYLSQFSRPKKKRKKLLGITVIDKNGNKIFDIANKVVVRQWSKQFKQSGDFNRFWRQTLERYGFKVVSVFSDKE